MLLFLGGVAMLALTTLALWACLPRAGRIKPFIDTVWEPYLGVAFTTSFTLSVMMIVASLINLLTAA